MNPYTRNMTQDATYWPPGANDGFGGTSYGAPAAIKCRWQDKAELFRDAEGREVTSSAIVYPDQELSVRGYLLLGESVASDPQQVSGAREIRQAGTSPALKGGRVLNKVWL